MYYTSNHPYYQISQAKVNELFQLKFSFGIFINFSSQNQFFLISILFDSAD